LEKRRRLSSARRFAKLEAFLAIVILLVLLSKITVSYELTPAHPPALPSYALGHVTVTSMNGESQMQTPSEGDPSPPSYPLASSQVNSTANEVLMTSMATQAGCDTDFESTVQISFTISNTLSNDEGGTVNITVFDNGNGELLASQLVVLDFRSWVPVSGNATFNIVVPESNPVFLVRLTFPTAEELSPVRATTVQVPLFEYLLTKAGLL
jgi:hypothetical protein